MTRVVFYTDSPGRGGAEISLAHLVRDLDPAFQPIVVGVDEDVVGSIVDQRPDVEAVVLRGVRNKVDIRGFAEHRRTIERLRPDIFHANLRSMDACQYAVLAAESVHGVRCIVVEQLPLVPHSAFATGLKVVTSRLLAAHVAVGEEAARMVERAARLRSGSVRTIYNGVPDDALEPAELGGTRPLIGCAARLDHIKGLDMLIDVLVDLPGVTLVLAGDGPDRAELELQVRDRRLEDRVHFLGWLENPRSVIAALDVFVLPSRLEGFPLSIAEAMLAGVPVVATDVGSVREAVDEETGRLVPPDDPAALRGALVELLGDPELRTRQGRAGRQRALGRFTTDVMVSAFESLYREVLA